MAFSIGRSIIIIALSLFLVPLVYPSQFPPAFLTRIISSWLDRRRPTLWYSVKSLSSSSDEPLSESFVQLDRDADTTKFIDSVASPGGLVKGAISPVTNDLRWFMGHTAINALTFRGSAFLFSKEQLTQLLRKSKKIVSTFRRCADSTEGCSLVDIGAGDGGITKIYRTLQLTDPLDLLLRGGGNDGDNKLSEEEQQQQQSSSPLFRTIHASEYSTAMQWRLWLAGFPVVDVATGEATTDPSSSSPEGSSKEEVKQALSASDHEAIRQYDVVSLLNVLDRCDYPIELLKRIKENYLLPPSPDAVEKKERLLVLSVVLPWCAYVEEVSDGQWRQPKDTTIFDSLFSGISEEDKEKRRKNNKSEAVKKCPLKAHRFDIQAKLFMEKVLSDIVGLEVLSWTRLPYISDASIDAEYAVYDALVMVLRAKEG